MHLAQINRPQQLHELIIKGSGGLPPLEAELLRRAAAHHQARRRRDGERKKGWGLGGVAVQRSRTGVAGGFIMTVY